MLETLKRFREPVAWGLLAAMALQLLLTIITFGVAASGPGGLGAAGYAGGYPLAGGLVIAAAAVLIGCVHWGPRTPNARLLTLLGAALFAAAVVLDVVIAVIGMAGGGTISSMLSEILQAALPALAAVVLYAIWESLPAPAGPRTLPGPPPDWGQPTGAGQPRRAHQPDSDGHGRPTGNPQRPCPHTSGPGRSQTDQFGPQRANWGINSAGYSGARQAPGPGGRPEQPGQRPEQPAWRPAPQPPPQRLEPEPGDSAVGPHNAGPASGSHPAQGPDPSSAGRSQ